MLAARRVPCSSAAIGGRVWRGTKLRASLERCVESKAKNPRASHRLTSTASTKVLLGQRPLVASSVNAGRLVRATTSAQVTGIRQACRLARPRAAATFVTHGHSARNALGVARADGLRVCRSAGLSTLSKRSTITAAQSLRFASLRSLFKGKGVTRAGTAGGNVRRMSSFPQGGEFGDKSILYGLVGLNILGTLVWQVAPPGGKLRDYLLENFMVSCKNTIYGGHLHTLLTANFTHSNMWNGAIASYMVYNIGSVAMQILGRRQFLALYLLGGAFSQLCQAVGPILATNLNLPTVLQIPSNLCTDGGISATLALLAWYCVSFPSSQVVFVVVPIQTGVAGALYVAGCLYTLVSNGDSVPLFGGSPHNLWRTMGGIAAGVGFALISRGRGRRHYQFIK